MSDDVSLLEVIKRGGYEASLITTFNATLPFYEEVVLRKLVTAGCRHNVVLMDRSQCAASWESQVARPRLAGHAYTLLPIGVNGAFHPKVCLLVGPKRASILVGSHNLTLSGLGFNREITNWIEVGDSKDAEGAAVLRYVWQMLREWIELERGKVPEPLLESALAIGRFISPLVANTGVMSSPAVLAQGPGGQTLIDQLVERITAPVRKIAVLGAFFDRELALLKQLKAQWPAADIVVGIDPDTVQHPGSYDVEMVRYVDAREVADRVGYLHAKALYLETHDAAADVFVSGSANPSRPAWMDAANGNVEAVVLQSGSAARLAAEATSMLSLFELPELEAEVFAEIQERHKVVEFEQQMSLPLLSGFSDGENGLIRISYRGEPMSVTAAVLLGPNQEKLETLTPLELRDNEVVFRSEVEATNIRSCLLEKDGRPVARAMILHPSIIESSSRSSRQYQIRSALSELGSSDADISKVIASVEKVIFATQTDYEIQAAIREHREKQGGPATEGGPKSLVISVADMTRVKRKQRLLKSGDLAYLIDVLMRRLSDGLEVQSVEVDRAGRSEEEQIGLEDEGGEEFISLVETPRFSDAEIAQVVARKARALSRKMVEQLKLASQDESRRVGASIQLIAVLALIRELRHLDKQKRWRATGQDLVEERDRRYLLDESIRYLLGSESQLFEAIDEIVNDDADETMQLRTLLAWLAWDLGDELTTNVSLMWGADEKRRRLQTNAVFLRLMPSIAADQEAGKELRESIQRTLKHTPSATIQAEQWLGLHMAYGSSWSQEQKETDELELGGYCRIHGLDDEPRVIMELDQNNVGFWDFGDVRKFKRDRVVGLMPIQPASRAPN
ncbi:hypothetical protein IPC426_19080 [Pseudomonas aeruginosa]|uniref:hypothetical protein n=1 Tax=Pseudomonas aeruginosa TaxID=287 RepID=UPI0007398B8B|nr:hypothetical protein [Pseudomonas aeruginosa]ELH0224888.1 hypothetical protein [Pseudomonas aeruginosa]ELK4793145.1 hypothetical protein [Pseudomonas aeruginosa]MBG5240200.1 hypothetical protein [Pseudomonas aeruginosa]MBH3762803.1 hypothetical protein [Pseudomonas aeruginosa]MBH9154046.1 hypothetical protein [Pseudomonas aeruginosa]